MAFRLTNVAFAQDHLLRRCLFVRLGWTFMYLLTAGLTSPRFCAEAAHLRNSPESKAADSSDDGPLLGDDNAASNAGRQDIVKNVDESVEDFEVRMKPAFAPIPGQNSQDLMTKQQQNGIKGMFGPGHTPDNFADCMLLHQYCHVQVTDSMETEEQAFAQVVHDNGTDDKDAPDVLVRPGAVYDSETGDGSMHVGVNMFLNCDGITNPIQVIPSGTVSKWTSKGTVPFAGFLCMTQGESDSAPVIHSLPTPCVPTSLDEAANALDPTVDEFEVFIGSTRVTFATTEEAETFCYGLGDRIATDMATREWDAEYLPTVNISGIFAKESEGKFIVAKNETDAHKADGHALDAPQPPNALMPASLLQDTQTVEVIVQKGSSSEHLGLDVEDVASKLKIVSVNEGPVAAWNAENNASKVSTGDVIVGVNGVKGKPAELAQMLSSSSSIRMTVKRQAVFGIKDKVTINGRKGTVTWDGRPKVDYIMVTWQDDGSLSDVIPAEDVQIAAPVAEEAHNVPQAVNLNARTEQTDDFTREHLSPEELLRRTEEYMAGGGKATEQVRDPDRELAFVSRHSEWRSPNLMSFCQAAGRRSTPEGWTKGNKRLLVIVMDWMEGDDSLAPYSHQDHNSIEHYKNVIFPAAQEKFSEMSYGQFNLDVTIVPEVLRYTRARNQLSAKMPFPGLYEEARAALQGHPTYGEQYLFRNFDLTFVIHPQTAPVGTKGLAWVGSRGAICNGCETLSDNFKVMVVVHELGHNLGLSHASSTALQYGNVFDWMGNYPDVVGLHYGLGYKYSLGWIENQYLLEVTDATLSELNDMVNLSPYDGKSPPIKGQVVGVKISLGSNPDDLFLSFRSSTIGKNRGLFVVHQDRHTANSKLVDCGCHTISQQDAHLQHGWTYIDDSEQVVVKVIAEKNSFLKVHVYKAPQDVSAIRARAKFTDGQTKCPMTCQDSDLLISHTCAYFRDQGFCSHGAIKLNGRQMNIGTEICPETCGKCEELIKTTPPEIGKAGCTDHNIQISGMDCAAIAQRQLCEQKTSSGSIIGRDLCPFSCGQCPAMSAAAGAADDTDPAPAREVGLPCPEACEGSVCQPGGADNGGKQLSGWNYCDYTCSAPWEGMRYCGTGANYEGQGSVNCKGCNDPVCPAACRAPTVTGGEAGNGGTALKGQICTNRASPDYGGVRYCGAGDAYSGDGSVDCAPCWGNAAMFLAHPIAPVPAKSILQRPSLISLHPARYEFAQIELREFVCEDDRVWRDPNGNGCDVYARTIKKWGKKETCERYLGGVGAQHCRKTCGSCEEHKHSIADEDPGCHDNACIGPWQQAYGRCYQCEDFSKGCKEPRFKAVFEAECPVTCGICKPPKPPKVVSRSRGKSEAERKACKDEDKDFCQNLGMAYCSEEKFSLKCPGTCEMCTPSGTVENPCLDMFAKFTCSRYSSYGWCDREDTKASVRLHCAESCGTCGPFANQIRDIRAKGKKVVDTAKRALGQGGASSYSFAVVIALLVGRIFG